MHGLSNIVMSITFFSLFLRFTSLCLKFNTPEGRQLDMKVYNDQSDTEVDIEVFEKIVKEPPGTF